MTTLNYNSIEEFCEELNECIEEVHNANEYKYVSVVAKYNDAKQIIREIIYYGYEIAQIEVNDPNLDDYDAEYEISVINEKIFCSKMKRNNKYLESFASIVFFMEDVNSKCIKSFPESVFEYEVQIDDDCDCNIEDKDCEDGDSSSFLPCCENDGLHGFTYFRSNDNGYVSHSFYSTECLKPDILKSISDILNLF